MKDPWDGRPRSMTIFKSGRGKSSEMMPPVDLAASAKRIFRPTSLIDAYPIVDYRVTLRKSKNRGATSRRW